MSEIRTSELQEGIFLHCKKMVVRKEDAESYAHIFNIEVRGLWDVDVTIDFTGSRDIIIESSADMVTTIHVPAQGT